MHNIYHNISSIIHFESTAKPEEIPQMCMFYCQMARMLQAHMKQHLEITMWTGPLAARGRRCAAAAQPPLPDLAPLVGVQLLVKQQGLHWLSVTQQYSLCRF